MNINKLSPSVTCPTSVKQGESKTFVGVVTGGTPPYTIQFLRDGTVIAGPDTVDEGVAATYVHTFNETPGNHTYSMEASDSCPSGAKTCSESCTINVTKTCNVPTCSFTIS